MSNPNPSRESSRPSSTRALNPTPASPAPSATSNLDEKYLKINVTLTGKQNYALWVIRLRILLDHLGQWDELLNRPTECSTGMNAIWTNIDQDQMLKIMDARTVTQAWKILETAHTSSQIPDRAYCIKKTTAFEYLEDADTSFDRVRLIYRELQAAFGNRKQITLEELMCYVVLSALPESFSPLRSTLLSDFQEDEKKMTLESIESRVKSEENAMNNLGTGSALRVTSSNSKKKRCDMHNWHNISTCWECHPERKPECSACKNAGYNHTHKQGSKFCKSGGSAKSTRSRSSVEFLCDSGATSHVVVNRQHIEAYDCRQSALIIANGDKMPVKGSGHMNLCQGKTTMKLSQVLHCPTADEKFIIDSLAHRSR